MVVSPLHQDRMRLDGGQVGVKTFEYTGGQVGQALVRPHHIQIGVHGNLEPVAHLLQHLPMLPR